ncbi:MAG: hypothetical protein ACI4SB_09170 [Acutalibacteraceae bacterium]
MSVNVDLFKKIAQGIDETVEKFGFETDGAVTENEDSCSLSYKKEESALTLKYENDIISLFFAEDAEADESKAKRLEASLLSSDAAEKDIKYVVGELNETLTTSFGKKDLAKKQNKAKSAPQTVSKNAVKHGSFYDPNTLASRLCIVFPELRDSYKESIAEYGEFLAEDFFTKYGTPRVIAAIKENRPATMKKLFQVLNEIYEDGTNETQSLIAVTILGELNNDQILLAQCVDYMSETMAPPVIEVNRYLASRSGQKARKKMENPPAYKPKKEKKKGFFDRMMSEGLSQQN